MSTKQLGLWGGLLLAPEGWLGGHGGTDSSRWIGDMVKASFGNHIAKVSKSRQKNTKTNKKAALRLQDSFFHHLKDFI